MLFGDDPDVIDARLYQGGQGKVDEAVTAREGDGRQGPLGSQLIGGNPIAFRKQNTDSL